ncbi:hypothetical protein [Fischerella thermalis]|uniref:hypothetical protein n=1 Tax=Fischerella thermalis TaxID=372787 RepID=UPI0015E1005D|nr:hypothetical protein [Fischerella thermalis]
MRSSKQLTANYQCTGAMFLASLPTNYYQLPITNYQLPITQYAFASPDRTAGSQKLGQ